jgi:hypothetical protein
MNNVAKETRGRRWWAMRFAPVVPRHHPYQLDTARLGCVEHEAEFTRWVHLVTHEHGWKRVTAHYHCTRSSYRRLRRVMLSIQWSNPYAYHPIRRA